MGKENLRVPALWSCGFPAGILLQGTILKAWSAPTVSSWEIPKDLSGNLTLRP